MHGSRAQLTIPLRSCYGQLKAMSTAAATKPAPRPTLSPGNSNWTTSAPPEAKIIDLTPNLSKWRVVPPASQSMRPPNLDRWAKQEPGKPAQRNAPKRVAGIRDRQRPSGISSSMRGVDLSSDLNAPDRNKWAPSFPRVSPTSHNLTDSHKHKSRGRETVAPVESSTHKSRQTEMAMPLRARTSSEPLNGNVSEFVDPSPSELYEDREDFGHHRVSKKRFKDRGSIASILGKGQSTEIPIHSRSSKDRITPPAKERKVKRKGMKKPNLDVFIPTVITVGSLARLLNVRLETLQRCMRNSGMGDQISYDHILSAENASLLAMEFDRNPVIDDEAAFDIYSSPTHPEYASLPRRPPIVTIMGHVDHGKTTLLDALRSTSVAQGEAGGITQHIGAFSVPIPSCSGDGDIPPTVTFLDTPGHAAFSAMRARGAMVTDIIVLVVAADDGVMPQTKEVIQLIQKEKGKVGVVVAINKVDKPGVDVTKVHNALWAEGIQLEVMGGDTPSVEVSGLTGQGLPELIENISLLAEVSDLRAECTGLTHGYVIESKVMRGLGNTATVLILRGSLLPSSHIICGTTYAKVRQLIDSNGKQLKQAGPGDAVIVSGWKDLPRAGDEVLQGEEDDVKKAVQNRLRRVQLNATLHDAEAINAQRRSERERKEEESNQASTILNALPQPDTRQLRLVLKTDVSGSAEAITTAAESIGNKLVGTKVVTSGVGEVTESDVAMAKAIGGIVVAFNTPVSRAAEFAASQSGIEILKSRIIYDILDSLTVRATDLLPPTIETRVIGEATVLELFDIDVKGKNKLRVAGCRVGNGVVEKERKARVLRAGEVIHSGLLLTLRIHKKDVLEVKKGLECGLSFYKFDDLRQGDLIQMYQEIEKPGQL